MPERNDRPTSITGKVKLNSGEEVEFSITADLGWQQWGNDKDVLGCTVDLMDALDEAAQEHLVAPSDDDEDEEPEMETLTLKVTYDPALVSADFMAEKVIELEGVDEVEQDVRGCSCGMADYGAPGHDGHDDVKSSPGNYRLHYTSQKSPGPESPWQVFVEEYANFEDEEPIEGLTRLVTEAATQAEADEIATALQRLWQHGIRYHHHEEQS